MADRVEPVGWRYSYPESPSFWRQTDWDSAQRLRASMPDAIVQPLYTAEQIEAVVEELRVIDLDGRIESQMSATDALDALLARFGSQEET